jgi:hypothetical protein
MGKGALAGLFAVGVIVAACGGDDSNAVAGGDDGGGTDGSSSIDGGTRDGAGPGTDGGTRDGSSPGTDGGNRDSGGTVDSGPPGPVPVIGGCQMFPKDNPWNTPIDNAPVHAMSATFIASIGSATHLHADWGDYSTNHYGIPWQTVGAGQSRAPMTFQVPNESDPGPYPFPLAMKIEAPTDSHGLVLDTSTCTLYEADQAALDGSGGFNAYSGAKFNLGTNTLRPDTWTSGDAAGLPILPGLVRLSEVQAGAINHAMRFTVGRSQNGFIHPATHQAGSANTSLPPMGLRVRLKASFSLSGFSGQALVILTAMKKYGLIVADNGTSWYITGDSDDGWTSTMMDALGTAFNNVHGSDFEAVDTGPILH